MKGTEIKTAFEEGTVLLHNTHQGWETSLSGTPVKIVDPHHTHYTYNRGTHTHDKRDGYRAKKGVLVVQCAPDGSDVSIRMVVQPGHLRGAYGPMTERIGRAIEAQRVRWQKENDEVLAKRQATRELWDKIHAFGVTTGSQSYEGHYAIDPVALLAALEGRAPGDGNHVVVPVDMFRHRWLCMVQVSGYHNGATCTESEPHGGSWNCRYVYETRVSATGFDRLPRV